MTDRWFVIGIVVIFALAFVGIWWGVANYSECRTFGHSVRYCLAQQK